MQQVHSFTFVFVYSFILQTYMNGIIFWGENMHARNYQMEEVYLSNIEHVSASRVNKLLRARLDCDLFLHCACFNTL